MPMTRDSLPLRRPSAVADAAITNAKIESTARTETRSREIRISIPCR